MAEVVVLLEFREDAEHFTRHLASTLVGRDVAIVALDDDAVFHLMESGSPFVHVEELLPPATEGKLCGEIWTWLEAFCEYADEFLWREAPFLEKGAPYLAGQIEVLKVVFDALFLRVAVLKNVFEMLRPQEIHFAQCDLVQPRHHRLFFDESFSLYSVLLETHLEELSGYAVKSCHWPSRYRLAATRAYQAGWWYRLARNVSHVLKGLRQSSLARTGDSDSGPTVCVVGGAERSLDEVVSALRTSGGRISYWKPQTVIAPAPCGNVLRRSIRLARNFAAYRRYSGELERLWCVMCTSQAFRDNFFWMGVDLASLFLERIRDAVTKNVAHQQVILDEAKLLLPTVDVLLSSYYSSFQRLIAFQARRVGTRVVSVQHGAMGHDVGGFGWGMEEDPLRASNKNYFFTDMCGADIKLAWGDLSAREMSNWKFASQHPRVRSIGARHLRHLKGIGPIAGRRKRILFVSNAVGNNVYVVMNYRGLGYRRTQYQLLSALAAHPAAHEIIYKAYPFWNRNEVFSLVRQRFPDKAMTYVSAEKKLPELFREADCVVLDMPTTGFYEACATDLPVFLFNRAYQFSEEVKSLIMKRAYYSESIGEFGRMMDRFQSCPDDFPALRDDGFLNAFCDIDNDVSPATLILEGQ